MIKIRHLLIAFLLFFLFALVLFTPVNVLWHQFGNDRALPVEVHGLSGTVWHGKADVSYGSDRVLVDWRFYPTRLLQGQIRYDATVSGRRINAEASIARTLREWRLNDVQGYADLAVLDATLAPQRIVLGGQMWFQGLNVNWQPGSGAVQAQGVVDWRNGRSEFVWFGRPQAVELPHINGLIATDAQGLVRANIKDVPADKPLADLELDTEGMAMYRIYTHIRDVLNVNLPGGREIIMESRVNVLEWMS
ncbi:type II secretion system protein N [Salinispirillum marinum]|uniref:Type II secretion system protein N n=2 Tax=Saccharospirillaceae TaxID=255527 RepID=A0ABV8BH70_9GAMM